MFLMESIENLMDLEVVEEARNTSKDEKGLLYCNSITMKVNGKSYKVDVFVKKSAFGSEAIAGARDFTSKIPLLKQIHNIGEYMSAITFKNIPNAKPYRIIINGGNNYTYQYISKGKVQSHTEDYDKYNLQHQLDKFVYDKAFSKLV